MTLSQKLNRIEKKLEKVRGVEYSLPFGSMRRAKVSRKWDALAQEKREILSAIADKDKKIKEDFLKSAGWQQYYHDDYWVNKKVLERRGEPGLDYTNHGLTLDNAFNFEVEYNLKNVDTKKT